MGRHNFELYEALKDLPKLKDKDGYQQGETCRSLIYDATDYASMAAVGSGTMSVEYEVSMHKLRVAIDVAIDADPMLQEIFATPRTHVTERSFANEAGDMVSIPPWTGPTPPPRGKNSKTKF